MIILLLFLLALIWTALGIRWFFGQESNWSRNNSRWSCFFAGPAVWVLAAALALTCDDEEHLS